MNLVLETKEPIMAFTVTGATHNVLRAPLTIAPGTNDNTTSLRLIKLTNRVGSLVVDQNPVEVASTAIYDSKG